jgi:hypothetical protein
LSIKKRSTQYLHELEKEFSGIRANDLSPISTWFSYGSNMFRQDFEHKMITYGSYLSLVRARPARLRLWDRRLDNESTNRGLAYSVRRGTAHSFVDGILHDVPIGDLPAFLRFEGILDNNYKVKGHEDERRYDIEQVNPKLLRTREEENCFVLVGHCPISDDAERIDRARRYKDKLIEYVRTSIKGAIDFGIDTNPFQKDLNWVEGISRA